MIQTTFEVLDAELLANDVIVKARQRKPKAKQPQDNQKQRNLFSLPPIQLSEQSLPAVPLEFPLLPIDAINEAVYAAIPKKLGDREYWSEWAKTRPTPTATSAVTQLPTGL